jgi:hypothetical protein
MKPYTAPTPHTPTLPDKVQSTLRYGSGGHQESAAIAKGVG